MSIAALGSPAGHLRTALFVDFENVHRGLETLSPEAGRRFATDPGRWLQWMERDMGPLRVDGENRSRAVLRRVCYLDPARSGRYRSYFTRAGFRVVDCPSLTQLGKNSADIHMVLDILDTLAHPAHYDEFIVLSVDADFTPVLLRLREHDRRTAMLLSGPAASALRSACDFVIPDEIFLEEALDLGGGEQRAPEPDEQPLREAMAGTVRGLLRDADRPLPLAEVAHRVKQQLGEKVLRSRWGGFGSFGTFVSSIEGADLRVEKLPSPGWLYDPLRHESPAGAEPGADASALGAPEVADRVHRVVGAPLLSSEQYAVMFAELAAGRDRHGDEGQNGVERAVRDACRERGMGVPRSAVHFVLLGYVYSGYEWLEPKLAADDLAHAFTDNVLRLCADAQMELGDGEQADVRKWITGGVAP